MPSVRSFDHLLTYAGQALGLEPDELLRSYRPAQLSELKAILELRRLVNGPVWWEDEAFVRWRYFSRGMDAGSSSYWVFERAGEILGGCGLEPVDLAIDGDAAAAVRALDIMVRPDLDGRGLGAVMNLALFRHFPIVLVTGSNDRSHQLLRRLFQHTLDLQSWKTVIESGAVLKDRPGFAPFAGMLAPGVDLLLRVARARRRIGLPLGTTIQEITGFDSRVNDLSRRCEVKGRVLARRSAEYLNWRFCQNPRCTYRVFGAFTSGRLDGYVVTRFNLARPNRRREAEVVDWLAAPDLEHAERLLRALLQSAVDALAGSGARLVSCSAFDAGIERVLDANGFRVRPGETLPFFVKAADPGVQQRLASTAGWFVTLGDFDVE